MNDQQPYTELDCTCDVPLQCDCHCTELALHVTFPYSATVTAPVDTAHTHSTYFVHIPCTEFYPNRTKSVQNRALTHTLTCSSL
jgi:hypothetical protein